MNAFAQIDVKYATPDGRETSETARGDTARHAPDSVLAMAFVNMINVAQLSTTSPTEWDVENATKYAPISNPYVEIKPKSQAVFNILPIGVIENAWGKSE